MWDFAPLAVFAAPGSGWLSPSKLLTGLRVSFLHILSLLLQILTSLWHRSIFSSWVNKYWNLLGWNQWVLSFFCYHSWAGPGANGWENPVMLSRPVSAKLFADWVNSGRESSHPQLCQMLPGVNMVCKITWGRKQSTWIFKNYYFYFFLLLCFVWTASCWHQQISL